jgi:hypothetical protein
VNVYTINPLLDDRWDDLVSRHPNASAFHQRKWLEALARTYGYGPVAFTTSSPACELKNALVFCRVRSWLTGDRLVSLPFSDHCEPLCDSGEELDFLIRYLHSAFNHNKWKYLEIRPTSGSFGQCGAKLGFRPSSRYFLHTLDLRPNLKEIFSGLNKDSVQRRIRRADRAGLTEKCGRSEQLLRQFYRLFVLTRGRHHVPPIPYAWFSSLVDCLGEALEIRIAYQGNTPIAGILTLRSANVLYYKYGCSDAKFNFLGAMPWLLWNAVSAAKATGATEFDMGRTQEANQGLMRFKGHWSQEPKELVYWSFPNIASLDSPDGWRLKVAQRIFAHLPDSILSLVGRLIYRHIG